MEYTNQLRPLVRSLARLLVRPRRLVLVVDKLETSAAAQQV